MNDDQLTALAREYAEAENPIESYGDDIVERRMDLSLSRNEAERILRWLTRRFCLVEKEAVRKEYQQAIEQGKHAHVRCHVESRAKLRLLESLFPEIAKEVEG